jgi:membrane associated rhomboid family serine protease
MPQSTLFDELKDTFRRSDNRLNQLILINVGVFLLMNIAVVILMLFNLNTGWYASLSRALGVPASPGELITRPWSPITYMFIHSGFFHILFNMLWLFGIGNILQSLLGGRRLLALYVAGGLAGAAVFILAFNLFPLFQSMRHHYAVGASASVLAVVVGAATLSPDYPIRLFLLGNVRLRYLALAMVVMDLLNMAGPNAGGHFAHLGGALFGYVYIKRLQQGQNLGLWIELFFDAWPVWMARIRGLWAGNGRGSNRRGSLRVVKSEGGRGISAAQTGVANSNEQGQSRVSQQEVDAVLDKISRKGYDSLTTREKEILFRASRQ